MSQKETAPELTPLQRRFVDEYLLDLNAAAAYRRAGYKASGNAAETGACRLLRNAKVKSAIEAIQKESASALRIDRNKVLTEYAAIAFCKMEPSECKPADKLKALEALGKHLGLFAGESGEKIDLDVHFQITVIGQNADDRVPALPGSGSVS